MQLAVRKTPARPAKRKRGALFFFRCDGVLTLVCAALSGAASVAVLGAALSR
jgi:hypothetical protein